MTIGGLGLLFAMLLLGRRRRSGELRPAYAEAPPASISSPTPVAWAEAGGYVLPTEVGVPRWRRQSLRESRGRSERDVPTARVELRFQTAPEPGVERRRVAYSLVSMRSEPDEILGEEIGWLDRGDEVDVLGTRGVHWLVRTPDGAVGWIHRTTLESTPVESPDEPTADGAGNGGGAAPAQDEAVDPEDFFRFSTAGLGAQNGRPRIH